MSGPSRLSPIPPFRRSPDARLPEFKALVIGNNSTSRPGELTGAVNDAKAVKEVFKDVYHLREEDITLMTDEDKNGGTVLWPSAKNILHAIDNFVRGASRGDVFVFYYAGHCGQDEDDDGEYQYIIACDDEEIRGKTLRERLISPLPMGSRLTVILDACHSGALLDLDYYLCRCAPRPRSNSLSVSMNKRQEPLRRNTEGVGPFRVPPNSSLLTRKRFRKAVTTTVAAIRLKKLPERKPDEDDDDAVPPTTPTDQHPVCNRCHHAFDFSGAPEVIFLSACAKDQQTWEDTKKRGKGMTAKLLKILKNEPCIKLGDLEERLKTCLYKLAVKRFRITMGVFRSLCEIVSPRRKERLENEYKAEGILEFQEQRPQLGSLRPVGPEEQFLLQRVGTDIDLPG